MKRKIAIIGGGPSGIIAALTSADSGAEVTIFEKNEMIGKKILVTGNGRCNITNSDQSLSNYNSGHKKHLSEYFEQFSYQDTLHFFATLGLLLKSREELVYPYSDQALSVLDILKNEIDDRNVDVRTQTQIQHIQFIRDKFEIKVQGEKEYFDACVIATGSLAGPGANKNWNPYQLLESYGHQIITPLPALVQIRCKENFFKSIAGVRCNASIKMIVEDRTIREELGELQITEYGISGIPVFQLSRFVSNCLNRKKEVYFTIDFLPEMNESDFKDFFKMRLLLHGYKKSEDFLNGIIHKKLNRLFLKLAQIPIDMPMENVSSDKIEVLRSYFKNFKIQALKTNGFENAQVSCGGAGLEGFDEKLESIYQKGLFAAGEVLDVDGRCGGYNLQWAWTSGYIAGKNAAQGDKR